MADFQRMDCAAWTAVIFCVCTVGSGRGCVLTGPTHQAQEGSDILLNCTFSKCPGPLDHTVHVNWEFNDTYTGIYTCSVRPFNSGFIYKNHTLLTVAPSRSGRRIMTNFDLWEPSMLQLILGCCGVGLLVLAAGGMLGVGAYWRRGRGQRSTQRKDKLTTAPTEETQRSQKDKDTDCYVTLQRCKAPPPASKEESIYMTMRGLLVLPGIQAQPSHNRKAIPTEWYAQENPPHLKRVYPPSLCPDSDAGPDPRFSPQPHIGQIEPGPTDCSQRC
ncbi:hypothetical protein SKAU_G00090610 [Synaphobranchus kaupii]|uniref:Ig-like domain-containing protein n=1 Tax=Synaphobranchus kaupii TaxID=118154 RepID=A0A9Q1J6F9_SYNKA|nr:hypothetical protein SKAU_G00090610 [Synaphobranchus kaupii]